MHYVTTIRDVASRARVSAMTVSRVLNGAAGVAPETRQRVELAIRDLNYVPSMVARSLSSGETRTIGLVVANLDSPFFQAIAHGAEAVAQKHDYRVILCNHDDNVERESDYIRALIAARVDGLVITPACDDSLRNLHWVVGQHVPFVLIDRIVDGVRTDYVVGDSASAAADLVSHLVTQGHRHIAIVTGPQDVYTARERLCGYLGALQAYHIPVRDELVRTVPYSRHDPKHDYRDLARQQVLHFLGLPEPPSAVFAVNHAISVHLLQSLRELGISSSTLQVACFEDVDPWNLSDVPIAAAIQPGFQFGAEGVRLLLDRMRDPEMPYRATVFQPLLRLGAGSQRDLQAGVPHLRVPSEHEPH
jgi:LacI family transcriptional regulator